MKTTFLALLMGFVLIQAAYSQSNGVSSFLATLDQNWSASDYAGFKAAIEARLASKPDDLPALMAKCDYYTTIETNLTLVQSLSVTIAVIENALNWNADLQAQDILDMTLALYDNPTAAQQQGYVFGLTTSQLTQLHTTFPSQYPGRSILLRFGTIQYPN